MRGAQQHDGQVHAEVEDLEDLRLGQRQDEDAPELGQRDSTEHLQGHSTSVRYGKIVLFVPNRNRKCSVCASEHLNQSSG